MKNTLTFEVTRKLDKFYPILEPLTIDFGLAFKKTVIEWTKMNLLEINEEIWEVWLINLKNTPVGISGLYTLQGQYTNEIWLGWLGLIPEYRNMGLGRQIMKHLYKSARQMGCKKILSYVDKDGKPLNFYKREGFQIIGTVREYCKNNNVSTIDFEDMDDWVIEKKLYNF
jgi:GNAT superfamily N-acetyltransferase